MAGTGTITMHMVGDRWCASTHKNYTNDGTVNAVSQGLLHSVTPSVSKDSDMLDMNSIRDVRLMLSHHRLQGSLLVVPTHLD
jgi:hypothetical protein